MKLPARIAVLLAGVSLVAAACAPAAPAAPTPAAPSPTPRAATPTPAPVAKKVKIASSLPMQGASRTQTITIVNAIKMALEEAGGKAGNTTVEYEALDDATAAKQSWDAAQEAENARKVTADRSYVAYIATFNSGAAKVSIPITCQANLAMVSPANTYPGLTKKGVPGTEADEPGKYYPGGCKRNYSRAIPADDLQGAVGARWAKELGLKKVYILHDTELYGKGVADVFRDEAKKIGIEEAGYEGAPKADNFRALANKVAASGADFVYYGGITDNNPGFLLRDLKVAKAAVQFMSVDGVAESEFIKQAGASSVGSYITFGGIPVSEYTGKAKEWADKYKAKFGGSPEVYAIYGYEAAKVVLAAIAKAGEKADDRPTVRDLIMGTKDFDGVLGKWSFDANGDTTLTTMAGMKVTKAGATFDESVKFEKLLK